MAQATTPETMAAVAADIQAERAALLQRERALAAARRRREKLFEWAVRGGALLVLLIIWEIFGRQVNRALFAPPSAVVAAAAEMLGSGELWQYLQGSLMVLAIGFGITLLIGIPLGFAMARSRTVYYALDWYIDAFNSTPNVALVPLITLIFGFDITAKVIVVVIASLFAVVVNTEQGVRHVDARLLEVARSFRSSERQLWTDVILPSALPYIAAGVRIAVGRALVGMVVAEFFTSVTGIGYLIVRYSNSFQPDHLLVPIVVVMALGILLTAVTRAVEVRIAPWSRQAEDK
ncbi:MAG TPA: ABC transporter permease [Chloroflexota bacterium]|nr:ABC transporter permease [Chloroflexota bacterium]